MDVETFTREIIPYKNKLYRIALRIVGTNAEAEDVVQEVFIKLWKKKDELHQLANKEAWCVTMTKNLSIDKTRSKHHRYGFVAPGMDFDDASFPPILHPPTFHVGKNRRTFPAQVLSMCKLGNKGLSM